MPGKRPGSGGLSGAEGQVLADLGWSHFAHSQAVQAEPCPTAVTTLCPQRPGPHESRVRDAAPHPPPPSTPQPCSPKLRADGDRTLSPRAPPPAAGLRGGLLWLEGAPALAPSTLVGGSWGARCRKAVKLKVGSVMLQEARDPQPASCPRPRLRGPLGRATGRQLPLRARHLAVHVGRRDGHCGLLPGTFCRQRIRGPPSMVGSGHTAPGSRGHGRSPPARPASLVPFRVGLPRARPRTPCLQTSTSEGLPKTRVQGRSSAELEGGPLRPSSPSSTGKSKVPAGLLRDQV